MCESSGVEVCTELWILSRRRKKGDKKKMREDDWPVVREVCICSLKTEEKD